MSELPERMARLEGTTEAMQKSVEGLKGYLERGAQERTTNHTLIIERLARLESGQTQMKESVEKYQKDCEDDREKIEGRVDKVERAQTLIRGQAAGISTLAGAIMGGIALAISWFHK